MNSLNNNNIEFKAEPKIYLKRKLEEKLEAKPIQPLKNDHNITILNDDIKNYSNKMHLSKLYLNII